jgi:phage major head subunit gpT-like protein
MLLAPGLTMYTFNKLRERPEEYRRYNRVLNSRRAYEEDTGWTGLGPLAPKPELETIILDEPISLGLKRFIHETFALGVAYSKEMRDDDQYGLIIQLASELGRSARWTAELFGHDVLNNGFSGTKYLGRDGKTLFATDHPLAGTGGTIANKPAVDVDLSEAALEAAIMNFENQVNDRGLPIDISPRFLIISPENRMLAKRLLESELRPGGNNNDLNVLRSEGLQVVVSHYITDKDAWFISAGGDEVDTRFYWREMPDTKTWDDDNADATFHKIRQRHSVGFGDWRGWYGSPGA